jgi:hypothetical protein
MNETTLAILQKLDALLEVLSAPTEEDYDDITRYLAGQCPFIPEDEKVESVA